MRENGPDELLSRWRGDSRMTKAAIGAARRLLWQSIAVRRWALWSLQPRWLIAFVLAVVATDLTAIGVAASSTAISRYDLALFGLLLGCTAASVELTRKSGEQGGMIKDVAGVWELPAAILLPALYALIVPIIRIALLQFRIRRAPVYRRVFSGAAISLSYGAASVTFHSLYGLMPHGSGGAFVRGALWTLVMVVSVLVKETVNKAVVMTAVKATDPGATVGVGVFGRAPLYNDAADHVDPDRRTRVGGLDRSHDHGLVNGLFHQDADHHHQGPQRAADESPAGAVRHQAVQAVEGHRRGPVGEADGGPAEDPAVHRCAADPELQQRYPDDRDDQRVQCRKQDGGWQLPHSRDVLDHAALLARLPGQLHGGRGAAQQEAEQGQVVPGNRGGRRRDADGGQIRRDDGENEGNEPAGLQRPERPPADRNRLPQQAASCADRCLCHTTVASPPT